MLQCFLAGLLLLFLLLTLILLLIRYINKPSYRFNEKPGALRGKTIIVTGANTGIGFETAAELARYGGTVILACRNVAKANTAKQAIVERLSSHEEQDDVSQRVLVEQLDLASFDSIRSFASRMLSKLAKLDVLINNAGVSFLPDRQLTKDGLEMIMGTNHFGHFLLTNLLLPLLQKSAASRIVVVSSLAHKFGTIDFENLNLQKSYHFLRAYANSKLANLLFVRELAKRVEGTGVIVTAVHPGAVITCGASHNADHKGWSITNFAKNFFKTPLEGAFTSLFLAVSQKPEALQSGAYFVDCQAQPLSAAAKDDAVAKKLWELSEKLTNLA